MRIWLRRLLAIASIMTVLLALPPSAAASGQASLADARNATASFHDVRKAERAGYGLLPLPCFDSPGVGGMGQHYGRTILFDGVVDVAHPEALVYEVDGDRLQLVAVEYIILQSAWSSSEAPSLLGHSFFKNDALSLWALHAWIWRPNPDGMFANYNPSVKLCPGH